MIPQLQSSSSLADISNCTVDVGVVADDQCFIVNWNGQLLQPAYELFYSLARLCEHLRPAVNNNKLFLVHANNPPAKETAVVRLVSQDVFITLRHVVSMTAVRIMQSAIWIDPKNELRIAVSKIANSVAPPRVMIGKKRETLCSSLA
jgi:hypothetical protein